MLETAVQCQAIHSQNCLLLKAVLLAVLQLSFRKTILDLCLRVQTKSRAAVDNFRSEDLLTDHRVSSSYFFLFFERIPIFSYFLACEAKICNKIENEIIVVCVLEWDL